MACARTVRLQMPAPARPVWESLGAPLLVALALLVVGALAFLRRDLR